MKTHEIDTERIKKAITEILLSIGEDPEREGLLETPERVANMYKEIFSGIGKDPYEHVKVFTDTNYDEMVIVRDIPLYSMCEHHLLPFTGIAHIAYIPKDGNVLGLSKLARIVDCFARRPQLQERLTASIADFIMKAVKPHGVAVIINTEHLCMTMRGAKSFGSRTQTSALRGILRTEAKSRAEVMSLLSD